MEASICFVINEFSNSSRAGSFIRESETTINRTFKNSRFFYITRLNELESIIEQATNAFDIIVACGGDGTIQSVAKYVYGAGKTLGVIPLGSGNDFSKSIGILPGESIIYYLDILRRHKTKEIDIAYVNNNLFLNTVGIGFDGLTNRYAQNMRGVSGGLKYTIAGIKAFFIAKPFSVSIISPNFQINQNIWMVVLANGAVEGGKFIISPNSNNSDGRVELVIFPAFNRLKLGLAFIKLSFGIKLNHNYYSSVCVKSAKITFLSNPPAHSDGEIINIGNQVELTLGKDGLKAIIGV